MKIQLIKEDVSEIITEEERKQFERNLAMLEASYYEFPLSLKELFDLYLYFRLLEEKNKKDVFDLRLAEEMGKGSSKKTILERKNEFALNMTIRRQIERALQREVNEAGFDYNVELNTMWLINCLKFIDKFSGKKSKKLIETIQKKQELLDEINEIAGASEPNK